MQRRCDIVTDRQDVSTTLPWMRQGTESLLAAVGSLADAEFAKPSRLPDWTQAHLIGHVARNAEALTRLALWARTGVETPMYADGGQRAAEIERSATRPPAQLRTELAATADTLDGALAQISRGGWRAPVRSALGRAIPAAEIPWLRCREVWLHSIDLGAAPSTANIPSELIDVLIDDVIGTQSVKNNCPSATLTATDHRKTWKLGSHAPDHEVSGPAAELAAWLTGRSSGALLSSGASGVPSVPRWL